MLAGNWRIMLVVLVVGIAACARQPEINKSPGSGANDAESVETASPSSQDESRSTAGGPTDDERTAQTVTDVVDPALASRESPEAENPDAETLLRRMADFYRQARSLTVESEHVMDIKMQGNEQTVSSNRKLAAERPNKLMLRTTGDMPGLDVYQNEDSLVMYLAVMNKYTEDEPAESFDAQLANPMHSGGNMLSSFALHLLAEDPYQALTDSVEEQQYLGAEEIDGEPVHHLRLVQDQFDWDIWIRAQGDPLLKQVAIDLSKSLNLLADGGENSPEMSMTETFRNWGINTPIEEETFVFTPPDGVAKVDSLLEGMFGEQELSPLVGVAAPPVELPLLDGGSFRLADHAGKDIVMLDFWATWCGPCVEELPLLIEVAAKYRDKGIRLYAVNQGEDPETIREFLDREDLEVTVAVDSDEAVGNAYDVEGIPMLVLVDKTGVVQAVHVGYRPDLNQRLRQELDDLLAGKNLAAQAAEAREASEAGDAAVEAFGMEEVWAVNGRFSGMAVDRASRLIYAVVHGGQGTVFDTDGEETGSFKVDASSGTLRAAQLAGDEGIELLAFGAWGRTVSAFARDGTKLWEETGGQGIDDVWAADLDDDGRDEVIVGYNGATGLHVFDFDGERRWKNTDLGNVWHVSAGDVNGDGKLEVVTTSAAGQIHLFAPDGKRLDNLDVPLYANMVRVGPKTAEQPMSDGQTIFVVGTGNAGQQMVAVTGDGTVLWTLDLPATANHCDSLSLSPDGRWAAAGLRGGIIAVVNAENGRLIAQVDGQGQSPDVNWLPGETEKSLRLLVVTGRALRAFRINADAK